jgi:hypothetical protein
MLNARLFKFWHDLPEALRTGRPQNEAKHGQKGMFEEPKADMITMGMILHDWNLEKRMHLGDSSRGRVQRGYCLQAVIYLRDVTGAG